MIVNIAAWLYIIQAALGLSSLTLSPFGFSASKANLATLAVSVLIGAMGVGLLQRREWARWFALGNSLLGWTVGSLLLIGLVVAFFVVGEALGLRGNVFALLYGGGLASVFAFIVLLFLMVWIATIVVSFMLFWYLCSREGCEEFGLQYGSSNTVVASVGAWIGIALVQFFMSSGGLMSLLPSGGGTSAYEQTAQQRSEYEGAVDEASYEDIVREREREQAELLAIQEAEQQAEQQAMLEASQQTEPAEMVDEAPAPTFGVRSSSAETEEPQTNRILKCRDASGAIAYTQGYCPPGSKQVETPTSN